MTFYFDDETGVMAIAFVEGAVGPCMYFETAIGVFRVERDTNKLVSVTIPFFFEKLADGTLSLPELSPTVLPQEVIAKFRPSR
jgi:hypothetical protein